MSNKANKQKAQDERSNDRKIYIQGRLNIHKFENSKLSTLNAILSMGYQKRFFKI